MHYRRTERTQALLDELIGQTCRCGSSKAMKQTFCRRCYYALPAALRNALYREMGYGYEQAYDEAVAYLLRSAKERAGEIGKGRRRAN
jgi:hypothetical protein